MTKSELIKALERIPEDLEVVHEDYQWGDRPVTRVLVDAKQDTKIHQSVIVIG